MLEQLGVQYSFVRIQSTALEQQKFEAALQELDANFLLHLALGHSCLVWDAGSRHKQHGASRALWYGLEFIRYTLTRLWFPEQPAEAYLRGHRVSATFDGYRRQLSEPTLRRLRYYQRYVPIAAAGTTPKLLLGGAFRPSYHDTDVAHHVGLLRRHYSGPAARAANAGSALLGKQNGAWQAGSSVSGAAHAATGCAASGPLHAADGVGHEQQQERARYAQSCAGDLAEERADWQAVADAGWGLWLGGLSHAQFIQQAPHAAAGQQRTSVQ